MNPWANNFGNPWFNPYWGGAWCPPGGFGFASGDAFNTTPLYIGRYSPLASSSYGGVAIQSNRAQNRLINPVSNDLERDRGGLRPSDSGASSATPDRVRGEGNSSAGQGTETQNDFPRTNRTVEPTTRERDPLNRDVRPTRTNSQSREQEEYVRPGTNDGDFQRGRPNRTLDTEDRRRPNVNDSSRELRRPNRSSTTRDRTRTPNSSSPPQGTMNHSRTPSGSGGTMNRGSSSPSRSSGSMRSTRSSSPRSTRSTSPPRTLTPKSNRRP